MSILSFPRGFLWGVGTSAYQIEGATAEGGRGESIWDRYAATPGNIADGTSGAVACDHYHRWPADVALIRSLNVGAYRFSIAWPRIMPLGRGAVNQAGLDFYEALVDGLLEAGVRPFVTLYHWDLPQALQDEGGWAARSTTEAFILYADAVSRRLGDRVKDWATHNEPWCIAALGHETGAQAPGHRDPAESLRVAHHVLLSHGRAVPVLRGNSAGARVGIVVNLAPVVPASPSAADEDEARRFDGSFNRWYLDPLFKGRYPDDAIADRAAAGHLPGGELPFVQAGDLRDISTPIDWLGVNYYSRAVSRSKSLPEEQNAPRSIEPAPAAELTDMGWEVYPDGLYEALIRVQRDYAPARILVTENGAAFGATPDASGRVADSRRTAFHHDHLRALHRAVADGVPVDAYFVWSLLDNFEWAYGYQMRFGIVYVDYQTQTRTLKDSALWYQRVAATNTLAAIPEGSGRNP